MLFSKYLDSLSKYDNLTIEECIQVAGKEYTFPVSDIVINLYKSATHPYNKEAVPDEIWEFIKPVVDKFNTDKFSQADQWSETDWIEDYFIVDVIWEFEKAQASE